MAAVAGRPEKNRLLFQDSARFPVLQHTVSDIASLVALVSYALQQGPLCRLAFRPEVFGEELRGELDDAIGCREDWLCRTIVTVERNDLGWRTEGPWKVQDVANRRGPEGIDGLRIVADDRQTLPRGLTRQKNRGLRRLVSDTRRPERGRTLSDVSGKQ
jgi:hypothetical protein